MKYHYLTNCTEADGPSITEMVDHATEITYDSLRRMVGVAQLMSLFPVYLENSPKMKDDPYVKYFRSTFKGRPCLFVEWSAIEFVFVKGD